MTAESQSTLERAFEIRLDDSPFRVLPGEQVRLCGRRDSCPSRPAEPTRLYARQHRRGRRTEPRPHEAARSGSLSHLLSAPPRTTEGGEAPK